MLNDSYERARSRDKTNPKGWVLGPWNSHVPIPIGYANQGIDEKHLHRQMFEIYMVAGGTATVVINNREVDVRARAQETLAQRLMSLKLQRPDLFTISGEEQIARLGGAFLKNTLI